MNKIFFKYIFFIFLFFSFNCIKAQNIEHVSSFGDTIDPDDFEFADIREIAIYGNQIFVLDNVLKQVHHLEIAEGEITRVNEIKPKQGRGPGELVELVALAVSESYVVIGDDRNQKIVIYDYSGELIHEFKIGFRLTKIYINENKNRLVVSGFWPTINGNLIHIFDLEGNEVNRVVERPSNWMEIARTGNFERVIPYDSRLFVSHPFPYIIESYSWSGEVLSTFEDQELVMEIESEGDFLSIDTRILDLQLFGDHILAFVKLEDSYQLDVFDKELNRVKTISNEILNFEDVSHFRVVNDQYILIRKLGIAPNINLYSLDL